VGKGIFSGGNPAGEKGDKSFNKFSWQGKKKQKKRVDREYVKPEDIWGTKRKGASTILERKTLAIISFVEKEGRG